MDDSFSVIEEDESEELIEVAEPVEIFECDSLPHNMEETEVAEEIEIESKSPRVLKDWEGTEDTDNTETQSSFDKFMPSTAWIDDNKTLSILINDCWVCFFFFTGGSNSTVRYS